MGEKFIQLSIAIISISLFLPHSITTTGSPTTKEWGCKHGDTSVFCKRALSPTAKPTTAAAKTTVKPTTPAKTTAKPSTPAKTTVKPTTPAKTTAKPTTPGKTSKKPTT